MPPALRLALIDNYDSYTHNLAHLLALANHGTPPSVILADSFQSLRALEAAHAAFDAYILSPGPGNPQNIRDFPQLERDILHANKPVLAVCLGHQALCATYGATIVHSPAGPAHGAVSLVRRDTRHFCPLLDRLPSVFSVVRYHSLAVGGHMRELVPTAWTTDVENGEKVDVLMAVRHPQKPLFGLQFHPESVCTQFGALMASNFVAIARALCPSPRQSFVDRRGDLLQSAHPVSLRTLVRKVDGRFCGEKVFRSLFTEEEHSFWLDSSTAAVRASPLSRCSSADNHTSADLSQEPQDKIRKDRFSLMGACNGPRSELVTYDVQSGYVTVHNGSSAISRKKMSIFDYLADELAAKYVPHHEDLPIEMNGGYFGFFGYELKTNVPGVRFNAHKSKLPDAWFIFSDRLLIFDHVTDTIHLVAVVGEQAGEEESANEWFAYVSAQLAEHSHSLESPQTGVQMKQQLAASNSTKYEPVLRFTPERSRTEYLADIKQCLHEIRNGESYEICLTNRLRTRIPASYNFDPLDFYCALRRFNPAPYAAFLRLDVDTAVCCSSPERYLQITSAGQVESKPIKGTLPRGQSLEEDVQLRETLKNSEKDRRENLMIVDLVRNDLSISCAAGSVRVPKLMNVESYATVHQLVSTVTGNLIRSYGAIGCTRAAYPMGSMTGAPKVRTMEIIDRLEHSARGIYSGSIGYLSLSGAANLNVVIRTAILNGRDVEIGVGGAIVALSDPEEEYEEVILKGKAIMRSLALQVTSRADYVVEHEQRVESDSDVIDSPKLCESRIV